MKLIWGLGKLLTLGFWAVVLINLVIPAPQPFATIITLAGGLVLLTHLLEVVLFHGSVRGRAHPWRDRVKIVLFGIFHVQTIGSRLEARHA